MTDFVFDDSALDAKTAQTTLDEALRGANRSHLTMDG